MSIKTEHGYQLKSLGECKSGATVKIKKLMGGYKMRLRLSEMGLGTGQKLIVIQNLFRGPVIVQKNGASLALGRGHAMKIIVEVMDEEA